nr:hypothetical protein CFP56_04566 [Quercus suber]
MRLWGMVWWKGRERLKRKTCRERGYVVGGLIERRGAIERYSCSGPVGVVHWTAGVTIGLAAGSSGWSANLSLVHWMLD